MKNKKSNLLSIFYRILKDLFTFKPIGTSFILIMLVLSVLSNYILLRFVDFITQTAAGNYEYNFHSLLSIFGKVMPYIIFLFTTNLITQIYSLIKIKYNMQIEEYLTSNIKKKLYKIKYDYFESSVVYEKLSRVNEKVVKGYNTTIESLVKLVEIVLMIIFYMIFLANINIFFAVSVILSIIASGIIATKMSKSKYKMFSDITKLNQKRDYLEQIPKDKIAHQEYQSNRLYKPLFIRYKDAYKEAQNGYLKIHRFTILSEAKSLGLFVITIFLSYLYLSIKIMDGTTVVGTVVSLMIIFDKLYGKTVELSYYISNHTEDIFVINEYYEIMEYEETQINERYSCEDSSIQFENISYCYPQSETKALDHLNLSIRTGEKIAIVGENGSGKTTFSNILLGLLTDFDGTIKIGSDSFSRCNPPMTQMAQSMNQDFTVYQTSIRNNILFGKNKELDDEQLYKILDMVGIKEFVNSLPEKLETNIGQLEENGIELSKGQEQKIAAARIIANSSTPVWIFDEPTAYLDPLAEIEMYQFLYELSSSKTMIFISHRLGFAPMADRIIVFEKGKVAEDGTHEELMGLNGLYSQMYQAQKSWYKSKQ